MDADEALAEWEHTFDELMHRVAGRFGRIELRRRMRAYVRGLLGPGGPQTTPHRAVPGNAHGRLGRAGAASPGEGRSVLKRPSSAFQGGSCGFELVAGLGKFLLCQDERVATGIAQAHVLRQLGVALQEGEATAGGAVVAYRRAEMAAVFE